MKWLLLNSFVFAISLLNLSQKVDSSILILYPNHIQTDSLEFTMTQNGFATNSIAWDNITDTQSLQSYSQLWIFSSGNNQISVPFKDSILSFLAAGKGVYLGAENEPFWEEANSITESVWNTSFYGNFAGERVSVSRNETEVKTESIDFYQGNTVSVFPMHPSFQVISWVEDEPLLLMTREENQKVIVDGGYSRFFVGREEGLIELILEYLE